MMANEEMWLNEQTLKKLMRIIELTREQEFSCLETFAVLDQYVEITIQCRERAEWDALVEHHIQLCEECRAEFEALMRILGEEL